MIVKHTILKNGFSINLFRHSCVEYKKEIWDNLPSLVKETIAINTIYLKVSPYSMIVDNEISFDFSKPFLAELGDNGVINDIPRIAFEDNISSKELLSKFRDRKIKFKDDNSLDISPNLTGDSILLAMSFGKDSLLSYAIAKELGLEIHLVMVQDFWDKEADHKLALINLFFSEFSHNTDIIIDRMDDISVYKRINKTKSIGIVNANSMNSYLVILIPLAIYYNSHHILFGSEQNYNDYFIDKEGYKVFPSYEQSSEYMIIQNKYLSSFTNDQIHVSSFVEPIRNLAEIKVLFNRYPEIAKYQMSCGLSNTKKERWCYNCPDCTSVFLYLRANNIDPKLVKLNKNLFSKEYWHFYPLFNNKPEGLHEKTKEARDEQLLAFYLCYKNGDKGYLIDKFRENFLAEAIKREKELCKTFYGIYDAPNLPAKFKEKIINIFKEELKCFH